uniref:Transmembrane protein n=1 Tax=Caenorhabditis japonica TaxID=281687 RepID=A0A8R1ICC0_CAEJA
MSKSEKILEEGSHGSIEPIGRSKRWMSFMNHGMDKALTKSSFDEEMDEEMASGCNILFTSLTVCLIIFGIARREECDGQPMIPIFIIVLGCLWLAKDIIERCRRRYQRKRESPLPSADGELRDSQGRSGFPYPCAYVHFLLELAVFVWFLFGCYWVFGSWSRRAYCDWWTFYIAVAYLLFSLFCLCVGAFCCLFRYREI